MPVYTPTLSETHSYCPDFSLHDVIHGKKISLSDFKNGNPFVIMFICNHCPYVKAIEDRLIQLAIDLKEKAIHVVGICSNDEFSYPEDSLENLRIQALKKSYSFTYLHDRDQSVAKKLGAVCTPDFFVYDQSGKLSYRGRLDDSWKDPTMVTTRELYLAVLEIAATKPISRIPTSSMGCSIKWLK